MQYVKATWEHSSVNDPVLVYMELDNEREEIRKIEVYSDGTMDYADSHQQRGTTELSLEPIPTLEEINSDPIFVATEITKDKFENIWSRALNISTR